MTPEQFADKLAALVTEARENSLSDDELIPILDDAVAALEEAARADDGGNDLDDQ